MYKIIKHLSNMLLFLSLFRQKCELFYFRSFFLLPSPSPTPPIIHSFIYLFICFRVKKRINPKWKKERGLNPFFSAKNLSCRICLYCGECFPQTTSDFIRSCLILMYCNCFWQEVLHFAILLNKEHCGWFFSNGMKCLLQFYCNCFLCCFLLIPPGPWIARTLLDTCVWT